MHREISHTDSTFSRPSLAGVASLATFLGFLILRDLWPTIARWFNELGATVPVWSDQFLGFRYAMIAAVIGGARILYGAADSLLAGRLGADMAVAVAAIAAIVIDEPLVAAEVVFIAIAGECLEAYTFARTQRGIRKLIEVFPRMCWLIRDGQEVAVVTNEVRIGDRVRVKPGKKVPVDGVIVEGQSTLDTSPLTGESIPVEKSAGDEVLAGCINQLGVLTVEARRVAEFTVAGQVIELTAKALQEKAPLERQADRLAKYFLPAVLAIAVLTFLFNVAYQMGPVRPVAERLPLGLAMRMSVYPTLAVLVVACPCALILATPAAVIAALGRLAGTGLLVKGGAALERLASVNAFAFDKTGTLTEGRMELGQIVALDGSESTMLRIAAAAERGSEHPLGRLVVATAAARGIEVPSCEEFQASPGGGIVARVEGATIAIGSRRFLEGREIAIAPEIEDRLASLDSTGETTILVARDSRIVGIIGARDRIRPDAADIIAELRLSGINRIALLTGDRLAIARSVADALNIAECHAGLLPAEKAQHVMHSGDAPERIAFVGDGINDAPALAKADVGIAVGHATDVAAEAGDIVSLGEPLRHLPLLVRLSRETVKIIRQNIVWFAFGVNIFGIILTGWLWPIFAGSPKWYERAPLIGVLYHQAGSLLVLLNSMRLLGFERTSTSPGWLRFRRHMQSVDLWLSTAHFDDLLHWLAHRWKPIASAVFLLGTLAYACTGLTRIEANEVGVVKRFGRATADLQPGLHIRWPYLIEEVVRVRPAEIRMVEIGYRSIPGEQLTWSSKHDIQLVSDESMMVTGDGNLVEVSATLRYRIASAREYLFSTDDPESLLRSATEAAIRERVSASAFLELLTTQRIELQRVVAENVRKRLSEMPGQHLGIEIEGLTVHDLHPPAQVVDSYHQVAQAIQARDQQINLAEAQATRTRKQAEEEGLQILSAAESTAAEKIAFATAARDAFLYWHRLRTQITPEEMSKYPDQASLLEAIEQRKRLTETRLVWEVLVEVLSRRDKIIIDADAPKGRRHLYLVDPEFLRPVLQAQQKGPEDGQ